MNQTTKNITLVGHFTLRGLESLKYGQIDLSDPRLTGSPGVFLVEFDTDDKTAGSVLSVVNDAIGEADFECAFDRLDFDYVMTGLVKKRTVTTGDLAIDKYIQECGTKRGDRFDVPTA